MKDSNISHLYIRNMVCPRCIQSVNDSAASVGINIKSIKLGEIILEGFLSKQQLEQFKRNLEINGFEIIFDKNEKIIEAIKTEVINVVQFEKKIPGHRNFSDHLSSEIGKDYSYLSNLFSSSENTTIEKYIILQKIEKTKELLNYDEHNLSEIAQKLGYSNTQHLSSQFKKITGMSPSQYKKLDEKPRKPIDQIICKKHDYPKDINNY